HDTLVQPCASARPARLDVVALPRQLTDVVAVTRDREDVRVALARGRKRQMAAVGRPRRALVAADAVGDDPDGAARDVDDLDVEARAGPAGIRDLVEDGRPGRPVG